MTREEAIRELKEDIELYIPLHGTIDDVDRDLPDGRLITALEMGIKAIEQEPCLDAISRQAVIDAFHTWFRDGFDEDKWWNSTHVLAAIEGIPSVHQKHEWETCFDCPLSHGCPKIKGCTNEQAIEYASKIPNDCPLSAQPERKPCEDAISRQAVLEIAKSSKSNWIDNSVLFKRIKNLSPVNPQPKTGHWIFKKTIFDKFGNTVECSSCHKKWKTYDEIRWREENKYCLNCGAKMSEIPTGSDPQESEKVN